MLSVNDCKSQVTKKGERNGPEWDMSQRFLIIAQQSDLETEAPCIWLDTVWISRPKGSIHISWVS